MIYALQMSERVVEDTDGIYSVGLALDLVLAVLVVSLHLLLT